MLRDYESMLIFIPDFTEDEVKAANQEILDMITKNGGEIVETIEMGKRELAYEIKKLKEGYYFVNHYKLDPKVIKELEQNMILNENILRYNILAKK